MSKEGGREGQEGFQKLRTCQPEDLLRTSAPSSLLKWMEVVDLTMLPNKGMPGLIERLHL